MLELLQICVGGFVVGSIYAVIALGFSLVYRVTGAINLAQGGFAIVAAMIGNILGVAWAWPLWIANPVAVLATVGIGMALGAFTFVPALDRLMSTPKILLLDEPSLGIAPLLIGEIFQLIVSLRARGITILLAEQNARQALSIADRGYVFENGRVTLSGPAKDLLNSPEIAARYLGIGSATEVSRTTSAALASKLRAALFPVS